MEASKYEKEVRKYQNMVLDLAQYVGEIGERNKILQKLAEDRLHAIKVASSILSEFSICPYNEVEDGGLEMCKECCTNNNNGSCWYTYLIKKGMEREDSKQ